MTKIEPVRCNCGKRAKVEGFIYGIFWKVRCATKRCWHGPWKRNKRQAVNHWNKVMEVGK